MSPKLTTRFAHFTHTFSSFLSLFLLLCIYTSNKLSTKSIIKTNIFYLIYGCIKFMVFIILCVRKAVKNMISKMTKSCAKDINPLNVPQAHPIENFWGC
ncbi:hypothetical protein BpHYR1_035337 [Brachionus plicatilis]|uniref:Uncharacterized protein n=1 Tax=Brachionus plicatilis TaxID=10195 RepID=A0A3M7S9Z8_BRAPC|nr:hypothetical protein BpHYR1_035337 [Brachionus plicatilis]